jgi:N-acetylmuramoyl-L-alanine amidase
MIIVTAAGHGGDDSGALNPYRPHRPEKAITLEIDGAFAALAGACGHRVYRVRTGDVRVYLGTIISTARNVGANLIIEFHVNSVFDSSAQGVEVWALPDTPSWRLAEMMAGYVAGAAGMVNRGVRTVYPGWSSYGRFVEVRNSLPGTLHVLTESGFISNPEDEEKLANPAIIQAIAHAHLAALHAYAGLRPPKAPGPARVPWLLLLFGAVLGGANIWLVRRR